jgi:hypothetical protein
MSDEMQFLSSYNVFFNPFVDVRSSRTEGQNIYISGSKINRLWFRLYIQEHLE